MAAGREIFFRSVGPVRRPSSVDDSTTVRTHTGGISWIQRVGKNKRDMKLEEGSFGVLLEELELGGYDLHIYLPWNSLKRR